LYVVAEFKDGIPISLLWRWQWRRSRCIDFYLVFLGIPSRGATDKGSWAVAAAPALGGLYGLRMRGFRGYIMGTNTNLVFGVQYTNILLYRKLCWAGNEHIQYYNTHYVILHLSKKGKGRFSNFIIGNYRFNNIISLNHDYL